NYPHDVAKAKALLAQAGLPNGLDLNMHYAAGSSNEPIAQAIQPQLAQAGIRVKLVPTTQADLGPQFRAGSIDVMAAATGVQPDPAGMLGVYFLGGDKLVPDASTASFKEL